MKKLGGAIILALGIILVLNNSALADNYHETRITQDAAVQERPVISNSYVAWLDWRNDADGAWAVAGGKDKVNKRDIYLYNLETRSEQRVTVGDNLPITLALTDNYLFWLDARSDAPGLYALDIVSGATNKLQAVADLPAWAEYSGNIIAASVNCVVFSEAGHPGLFYYNLKTKKADALPNIFANGLALSGERIVWSEAKMYGANIKTYDFSSNVFKDIIVNGAGALFSRNVAAAGDRAVWLDGTTEQNAVKLYDFKTGLIETLTPPVSKYLYPAISENAAVWSGWDSRVNRFVLAVYTFSDGKLRYHGSDSALAASIAGNRVVFESLRGDKLDIYSVDLAAIEKTQPLFEEKVVVTPPKSEFKPGELLKASSTAVYYFGADGKRYVFPNAKTYFTWYADYAQIKKISDEKLAEIILGGNVTYRPGARIIKSRIDNKLYAVGRGGARQWLPTADLAKEIFGADWKSKVEVIPDAFWLNYSDGPEIKSAADHDSQKLLEDIKSIDEDRGLVTRD